MKKSNIISSQRQADEYKFCTNFISRFVKIALLCMVHVVLIFITQNNKIEKYERNANKMISSLKTMCHAKVQLCQDLSITFNKFATV